MKIVVREATMRDYAGMCALFAEIDALHAGMLPRIFQTVSGPARSRAYVMAILDDPDAALFVAEREGQIIGLIDVRIHETPDMPILVPRCYAVVETIVVSRNHQRSGAGRALMERAEQWARERGLDEVFLTVWEFNTGAVAFYERLGYTTVSRRMSRRLG